MRAADLAESILRGYAAIVCNWEATLAPDRGGGARTRRAVERLCELGTDIFVLSDADLATVDGRLQALS